MTNTSGDTGNLDRLLKEGEQLNIRVEQYGWPKVEVGQITVMFDLAYRGGA